MSTMTTPTTCNTVEPRFVALRPAARFAGVSVETLRRWMQAGRLKKYKPLEGLVLVDLRELTALIEASAVA
jgi:predicted site-specific integrase-resolvase